MSDYNRSLKKKGWSNIGVITASALVGLAIGVIIGEVVLRRILPPSEFTSSIPLRANLCLTLRNDLRGVSKEGVHSTNRWGMRGDQPPEDFHQWYTILAIG